jgi:hypothetical protein
MRTAYTNTLILSSGIVARAAMGQSKINRIKPVKPAGSGPAQSIHHLQTEVSTAAADEITIKQTAAGK